ncbi:hypothetical protein BH09CHL1_BH09CHL1_20150 [soil metagenome]
MENKTFSGASLEEALKGDTFAQSEILRIGMVKQSQTPGYIGFSGGGCEHWIEIPIDMIERAEQMGNRPCKDHSHPVFRITLKQPKDPETQIFASFLAQEPVGGAMTSMPPAQTANAPMMQGSNSFQSMAGSGMPGQSGAGRGSSSARMNTGGFGGLGGGLNAWGCWDSTCTTCTLYEYVCNGSACWWICKLWYESPCERCIWPY